eukprot:9730746-Alexandrium_andersonii.AAC.1
MSVLPDVSTNSKKNVQEDKAYLKLHAARQSSLSCASGHIELVARPSSKSQLRSAEIAVDSGCPRAAYLGRPRPGAIRIASCVAWLPRSWLP